MKAVVLVFLVLGIFQSAWADVPEEDTDDPTSHPLLKLKKHHYHDGDKIELWANTVGPYANPTETYQFYHLPLCKPVKEVKKGRRLGEVIQGDRAVLSDYQLPFKEQFKEKKLCDLTLTKADVEKLKQAIKQLYYFEMIYDDLPIHGFIGTTNNYQENPGEPIKYYLYKHLDFFVEYNKDQVIRINASTGAFPHELPDFDDPALEGEESIDLTLTYSATWTETDFPYKDRRKFYETGFFKDREIHWLSIMNSAVLVILLTGFLAIIIMRVLKSDYARYAKTADDIEDDQADYGWKLIHGDVFRFPAYKNVFCAYLGIGAQFLVITAATLAFSLFGLYYPTNGGNMYASAIGLYAVTSGLAGFVSGRMYKQFNGDQWAWNIVLTATLFAVPFVCVVAYANSVAIYFHVTAALPFLTILEVVSIYAFVGFPLTVLGGITGRRLSGTFEAPCRTKNFPREIPAIPWYRTLPFQMLMAGFLPFSAVYIELFYIYSSVWGHFYYTLYGILCLVFLILLIVTACITVALTYFQLSMEDHRWWWTSFINGGSTGIFIYIYSICYYIYRSNMTGMLQGSFYFAYMLVVCYFFFILLGSVGFFSSLLFVRSIYRNLHSD
jgi:MFS family permease